MLEYGPQDQWVAQQVAADQEQRAQLLEAFGAARQPLTHHLPLQVLTDAYIVAGYYYAVSKDLRRRSDNGDKLDAQLCEDYLEALVKGLNTAVMATMNLGKLEKYGT
jgi:hypothetical protein